MHTQSIRILLVEHDPGDARQLCEMVRGVPDLSIHHVDRLAAGLEHLAASQVDVVLLDLDGHGLETVRTFLGASCGVPAVVLAGRGEEAVGQAAVREGALDYLVKGLLGRDAVTRAVRYAVESSRLREKLSRLNLVLRAIRGVKQLIAREKDPARLAQQACSLLVELGGYGSAFLVLADDSQQPHLVAGVRGDREDAGPAREAILRNGLTACMKQVWRSASPVITGQATLECADCPLNSAHRGRHLACRLMHGDRPDGVVVVALPEGMRLTDEEPGLLADVADEVGRALRSIDQDERRGKAEHALAVSERRYRRLFEAAKDGILILDATTGRIVDVNPFMTELTGCSREEFLDRHLWDIGPFRDIADSKVTFADLQTRGFVRYDHLPLETHSGRRIPVEFVSNVYRVDDHDVIQCNIRDISKRQRAEDALREKEHLLSESQRLGRIGSWLYNFTGPISWSEELYRLYGVSPETFTPTVEAFLGLVHPDDRSRMQAWMAACSAGERPGGLDFRVSMPDGTIRSFRGLGEPVLDAGNKVTHMAGTVQDITRDELANAEREKLEQQLRASRKMEAIGCLAGGIAHDFNNLLTVIQGYTEFALEQMHARDPLRADLQEVHRAGQRAAALTSQLLAFSRNQVLQPVPLDLNKVVIELEKMLRRVIGEDVELVEALAPDLGLTMADPGQIEQVIMNLVINARDAMPTGGRLTIETSNEDLDEEYAAQHMEAKPGPHVQLAVSDSGCGMDSKTRERVFEPFFTTKQRGKGTGLGLSTVYGIVKQSGGDILVYSEPGQGTTFKIHLPRAPSTTLARPPAQTAMAHARGTETILVVEDEQGVRDLARRILGAAGYTVLTAANGGEALLTFEQHPGKIHLVLTDVVMPLMSGRVLIDRLAKVRPESRTLYMSGYTDDAIVVHGVLEPGVQFISKPFSAVALTRKVREVLDEGVLEPEDRSHPV